MKNQLKLFTYMTKPLVLFVLLFALGVGQMWGDVWLSGPDWGNWGKNDSYKFSDGKLELSLAANTDYTFKVYDEVGYNNNHWRSYDLQNGKITGTIIDYNLDKDNVEGYNLVLHTAEAGTYIFHYKYEDSKYKLSIYFPRARFDTEKVMYFDASESNWTESNCERVRYYYKYYDSNSDQSNADCAVGEALETKIFYTSTPNNSYVGNVQIGKVVNEDSEWKWKASVDEAHGRDRSSTKENCVKLASSGTTVSWTTYCPPMSSVTLADNGTTTWGGNGSSGSPYLVPTEGDIKVHVTASASALDDANMTKYFLFKKAGSAVGSGSSSTEMTITASGTTGTKEAVIVEAYNYYNSTEGTHLASSEIYYEARTPYTISYNAGTNGSGSKASETKLKGVNFTLPNSAVFERTGYTQTGWTTSDGGTQTHALGGSYTGDAAQTFYPVWTANEYTVTLNNRTGTTPGTPSVSVTYNSTTGLTSAITKPTKTYYDFGGYYTSTDNGVTITETQLIDAEGNWVKNVSTYTGASGNNPTWIYAGDITLYAKWTEHDYAITINIVGSGSTSPASSTTAKYVTPSGDITATPSTGYSFREWSFSKVGESDYDVYADDANSYSSTSNPIHILAQRDGTMTANFTANGYTVTLENMDADEGHKGTENVSVTYDATTGLTTAITKPEKEHYVFGGYYISTNKGSSLTDIQLIDADGNWKKDITNYTSHSGDNPTWVCAGDTTLYAKWTEKSHTVTVAVSAGEYEGTPGTVQISSADESEVTAGEVTWSDVLTPIANPGWKFKEWQKTTNVDFDDIMYHTDYQKNTTNSMRIKASADGQTLTAVFEPRFELAGSKTATGDPAGGMPGWSYDGTGVFDPIILTDTCTLEANTSYKCSIHDRAAGGNYGDGTDGQYKLTEEYNAHCSNENMNMLFNSTVAGKYLFKITGFDDDGRPYIRLYWPRQVNFGRRTVDIDGGTHDDDTGGTLSVKAADTTITSGTWHTYNTNVAYDADNKAGYQLTWYNSSSYTETFTAGGEWDHNLTGNDNSYAQFSELATKVSLENDGHGHVEVADETQTETTCGITTTRSITAVPNTGYSFSNWTKPSGDDINFNTATNPTTLSSLGGGLQEGQRVYAHFAAKTYSVTLNDDHGGSSNGSATVDYDATSLSVSSNAGFEGWTLLGYWNTDGNQVTDASGNVQANVSNYTDASSHWKYDNNVTLYAHWSRSVTLDKNGDNGSNGSVTVTYQGSAATPSAASWSGYTVEGYYTNAACTTKVMEANGKLMESVTGYTNAAGKWTKTDATTLYTKWVKRIYRTGDNSGTEESYSGSAIPTSIEFRMKVHEAGKWYSLCLPFTVDSVCVWDDEDGHYYSIVPYYRSGGNYYKGHYVIRTPNFSSGNSIAIANFDDWVDPSSSGNPSANTPYIIQWPNGYFRDKYISFFGKNASTWPNSMTAGDAPTDNSVVNVYGNATMVSGSVAGAYMLDNDYGVGAWLRLDDEDEKRAIPPFECYILASSEVRSKYLVIRRGMTIEDTATGWEQLKDPSEGTSKVLIDGELFIIRGNQIYTIQGALVK